MKLIKAYVRTFMVEEVVRALKDAGAPRMAVIDVRELGDEVDPEQMKLSSELGSTYTTMSKIELACHDKCIEKAREIICDSARTGRQGDGLIVISPVEDMVSIRRGTSFRPGEIF